MQMKLPPVTLLVDGDGFSIFVHNDYVGTMERNDGGVLYFPNSKLATYLERGDISIGWFYDTKSILRAVKAAMRKDPKYANRRHT